jgi:DNA polymerase-3 subunit delta
MREAGLAIAPDARAALVPLLGGDRLASRSELHKLVLYARGKSRVELADVAAVVADASDLALDALVDAVFAGRIAEVEALFAKARNAGTAPGTILFMTGRHVSGLHRARIAMDDGQSADAAVQAMWLNSQRAPRAAAAIKAWTAARLERAMAQIADAALDARKETDLAEAIAQRALLSIAVAARRRG